MNTFYHGDCLFVLRHDIPPESIDLIYLDPPFFTGKIQKGKKKWQPGTMEISYDDSKKFWGDSEKVRTMRKKAPEWLIHIAVARPDFASYLYYMMERLQTCHKVLKPTGSIYLHCDYRASHYLKMVMDEIFEFDKFRNEIVWFYPSMSAAKNYFPRKHDIVLYYSKSDNYTFNGDTVREAYDKQTIARYNNPVVFPGGYKAKINKEGRLPYSVWQIPPLRNVSKEKVGYPTQKPLALLKRIIQVSSNKGNIVLDPFCGCGTAIIAAQKEGRQWIGIDINKDAYDVSKGREHQLPLAQQQEYKEATYISRYLPEVKGMSPSNFEKWVNEFYGATKPHPDRGVDGITKDGIPIQTKTFLVRYDTIDKLIGSSKHHPLVPQPMSKIIVASQTGFDDSARERQFQIKTTEGIEVCLSTPKGMLKI